MPGRAARWLAAVLLTATVLVPAAPAGADPARPTDYRATVLRTRPALPAGVTVRVVGGDAFLEVHARRGHRVVVPDYGQAAGASAVPYLRFRADGTVERNRRAVATAANASRYGEAPPAAGDGEPRWERVATGGRYAWHDHRIHWMSPTRPRAVDAATGRVDLGGPGGTWEVPMVVDGRPTTVVGELVLVDPPPAPAWVVVAGALALAVLALATARGWGPRAASVVAGSVSLAAATVGWSQWHAVPAGSGGTLASVAVVAVPLGAAVAALLAAVGPPRARLVGWAASAAGLVGWGALRWSVTTHAVLVTTVPAGADRAVTAAAVGVGIGLAAALVWRPPIGDPRPPAPAPA